MADGRAAYWQGCKDHLSICAIGTSTGKSRKPRSSTPHWCCRSRPISGFWCRRTSQRRGEAAVVAMTCGSSSCARSPRSIATALRQQPSANGPVGPPGRRADATAGGLTGAATRARFRAFWRGLSQRAIMILTARRLMACSRPAGPPPRPTARSAPSSTGTNRQWLPRPSSPRRCSRPRATSGPSSPPSSPSRPRRRSAARSRQLAADHQALLFIATSNFEDAIDPALLSRADLVEVVPRPRGDGARAILRSSVGELARLYPAAGRILEDPEFSRAADACQGLDGRALQAAAPIAEAADSPAVAQAWFLGMNPLLDDRSPLLLLSDGDLDEAQPAVMGAARAFVAAG